MSTAAGESFQEAQYSFHSEPKGSSFGAPGRNLTPRPDGERADEGPTACEDDWEENWSKVETFSETDSFSSIKCQKRLWRRWNLLCGITFKTAATLS